MFDSTTSASARVLAPYSQRPRNEQQPSRAPQRSEPDCSSSSLLVACAFCYHLSAGPMRVLGRSARPACGACYGAILNLTICWVCGEVVRRGGDCVSLGWCFWHKACYGCVFCGSKAVVSGVTIEELFDDDEKDQDVGMGRAVEIVDIPLCANCLVDVEKQQQRESGIIQQSLERISRADGGLSLAR